MSDTPKQTKRGLDEGTLKKGGVNSDYQITTRPPPPAPMQRPIPSAPQPTAPEQKKTK